ncbi:MAG: hypothetical protein NVSMB4_12010 [Acidimicrobiales bacterium]
MSRTRGAVASAELSRREREAQRSALEAIGLRPGEQVRFRRPDRSRWQVGIVSRMERDGSLRITDADGAARTVALALGEVTVPGARRTLQWEPLADRAVRAVQLTLL